MLLPFLTLGVECEWGGSAPGSSSSSANGSGSVGDVEVSLLSTAVFMGMLFGALLSGLLSDRIGRRPTVMLLTGCTGLFGLGSALAPGFRSLLFCRTLVGLGVGGSPAALSLFTEFLPRQSRGEYLVHYMLFFSAGAVVEVALAWAVLNALGWRVLLLLSALPALLLTLVVYWYCPESASWLLSRGQRSRASLILRSAFDTNHPEVHHGRSCAMHVERAHLEGDSEEEEEAARSVKLIPCSCGHAAITAAATGAPVNPGAIQSGSSSSAVVFSSAASSPDASYDPEDVAVALSSSASGSSRSTGLPAVSRRGCVAFLSPLRLVFSRDLRAMSALLCLLFFLMAFVYYSLVLLSLSFVQLQSPATHSAAAAAGPGSGTAAGTGSGSGSGSHGAVPGSSSCSLDSSQFLHLFLSNLAEFPGLALCFLLLERLGRRSTITLMFLATAGCITMIPLVWACNRCGIGEDTVSGSGGTAAAEDCPLSPLLDWIQSLLLFCARACSLAFNQALWIYSTELFPAEVRSSGLGVTTLFARIGGAVSPWVVQLLFWRSRVAALASCVGASLLAAAVAHAMPKDTKGQELQVLVTSAAAGMTTQRRAQGQQAQQQRRRPTAAASAENATLSVNAPRSAQAASVASSVLDDESAALNRPVSSGSLARVHPAPSAASSSSASASSASASLPDALPDSADAASALSTLNLDILRADAEQEQDHEQAQADDEDSRRSSV